MNLGVAKNRDDGQNNTTVKLGANNALGTGLVTITDSGTKLDLAGYSVTTTPIAGISTTQTAALIKNSGSTASTLTLNVADGKSYSYAGKIENKINLVKTGAGTQTLSGSGLTFNGLVTVSAGTLDLNAATLSNLTGLSGTSDTAVLKNSNTTTATNLTLNTASDQSYAGTMTGKFSITKTGSAKQTLNASTFDSNFTVKVSAGTLALTSCPNTLDGSYTLDGGTLNLSATSGAIALKSALQTTANGGTLSCAAGISSMTLSGTGNANTVVTLAASNNSSGNCPSLFVNVSSSYLGKVEITLGKWVITTDNLPAGGTILSGGEIMGTTNDVTLAATKTISLTADNLSTLRAGANKTFTINSKITGAGQLGISTDNGTVVLTNSANDFTGGLVVGTLKNSNNGQAKVKAGAANVLGTGTLEVVNSTSSINEVNLNGYNQTVAGLISSGANAKVYDSTTSLADLTLNVPAGKSYEYKGTLQKVDLIKTGLGTQTISGTVTGVQSIQVQQGTLEFADNSYNMSGSSISISDNAILALNDVTITDLDTLTMEGSAAIKPTGDMFSLAVKSFLGDSGTLTWDGSTLGGNLSYYLQSNGEGGFSINPSAVPEPATWVLLVLGAIIMGFKRSRSLP